MGKESDIYVVAAPSGQQLVLKIHRLGRISFRTVKNNRDYERGKRRGGKFQGSGWMYMSRLAATKEFAFMKALGEKGLNVPEAIAHNRHTVVMGLVDALPLRSILEIPDPGALYQSLMEIIVELKGLGLIHGDFNEFNILLKDEEKEKEAVGEEMQEAENSADRPEGASASDRTRLTPVVIDFPQMLSISHPDAEFYFDRDVNCVRRFFERRFHFVSDVPGPFLSDGDERQLKSGREIAGGQGRIDVQVEAAGFSRKMEKELQAYMKDVGVRGDADADHEREPGHENREAEEEDDTDEDQDGEGVSNKSDDRIERPTPDSLATEMEVGHGKHIRDLVPSDERDVTDSSLHQP